jgi:hypothetical protein
LPEELPSSAFRGAQTLAMSWYRALKVNSSICPGGLA